MLNLTTVRIEILQYKNLKTFKNQVQTSSLLLFHSLCKKRERKDNLPFMQLVYSKNILMNYGLLSLICLVLGKITPAHTHKERG